MTTYRKRPRVTRFQWQPTKRGRGVRKATVERRERKRPERKFRSMRPMKKNIR